jgi:hypothetical protein
MLKRLLAAVALAAIACGAAAAQSSVQQAVEQLGLLGTWASDCGSPPARTNIYTVYKLSPAGGVRRVYYDGPRSASGDAYILNATLVGADQISYEQELTDRARTRITVLLTLTDDRIRVLRSQRADGQLLVDNGTILSNGMASPWQFRCRGNPFVMLAPSLAPA